MQKTVLTLIGLVVLAAMAFGVYVFIHKTKTPSATNTTNLNSGFGLPPDTNGGPGYGQPGKVGGTKTSSTISVANSTGGTLSVRDFTKDPDTVKDPLNPGQRYLGYHFPEGTPDTTATDHPPYTIDYFDSDHSFNIIIFQEPIVTNRILAEQDLMRRLGITEAQMCYLKYGIGVPNFVNQFYAGQNLGFSFCPGAVKLAQ